MSRGSHSDPSSDLTRITDSLSSRYWSFLFESALGAPQTLIQVLSQCLPHIEPASWKARLAWGGVYLNGRRAQDDRPLTFPCRLEYYEPKFEIDAAQEYFPALGAGNFVYEDDDLLVVFKPAGLPCLPTREQPHFNLKAEIAAYMTSCDLAIAPHLPSRLDTAVSGLIAISKSKRMHKALQRMFETRCIRKIYLLEVAGTPMWIEREVREPIAKDPRHPVLRKVCSESGLPAHTSFRMLYQRSRSFESAELGASSVLAAYPHTGRTHQIRVHMAHIHGPIIGDNFYGGLISPELHLISYGLEFDHPFTASQVNVRVPQHMLPTWLDAEGLKSISL